MRGAGIVHKERFAIWGDVTVSNVSRYRNIIVEPSSSEISLIAHDRPGVRGLTTNVPTRGYLPCGAAFRTTDVALAIGANDRLYSVSSIAERVSFDLYHSGRVLCSTFGQWFLHGGENVIDGDPIYEPAWLHPSMRRRMTVEDAFPAIAKQWKERNTDPIDGSSPPFTIALPSVMDFDVVLKLEDSLLEDILKIQLETEEHPAIERTISIRFYLLGFLVSRMLSMPEGVPVDLDPA